MTTIINNPGETSTNSSDGGYGVIIGAVLVVLVLVLVLFFTMPYFRQRIDSMTQPVTPVINPTINVQLPTPTAPATPAPAPTPAK
ncbi:MAG: hypothetical protein V4524_01325 [Patescibacteria group bacterium]